MKTLAVSFRQRDRALPKAAVVILVFGLAASSACGPSRSAVTNDPDPENRRLAALKREPARRLVPDGMKLEDEVIRPRKPGTEGFIDAGKGPEVIRRFSGPGGRTEEQAFALFEIDLLPLGWQREPSRDGPREYFGPRRGYARTIEHWCAGIDVTIKRLYRDTTEMELRLYSGASYEPWRKDTCEMRRSRPFPSPSISPVGATLRN